MPSTAQHLIFVYAAGPGGYWLYRYLTKQDYDCWGVASSLIPNFGEQRERSTSAAALQK
jgi:hypothetical protein